MKLKVIHLLRRLERIERDLEELDGMLSGLPMDREYSIRLRDSLIEESSRLKDFKQKILTQRVISEGSATLAETAATEESSEVSIQLPSKEAVSNGRSKPRPARKNQAPAARPATTDTKQETEKPAFEFRFE